MFARILSALLHVVEFASVTLLAIVAVVVALGLSLADGARAVRSMGRPHTA